MSWYFWVAIGTWACALAATVCSITVICLITMNRRAGLAVMQAIEGLGEAHRQGFEALTMDIDRLKQRVLDLETDAL